MKYRKKPVEIEAIKWNGSNVEEVINFCNDKVIVYHEQLLNGVKCDSYSVSILTLEGVMGVDVGDYIIKGIKGECYPCKPDIFEMTYEKCEKNRTLKVGDLHLEVPIEVLDETNVSSVNENKSGVELQSEVPIKFKSK